MYVHYTLYVRCYVHVDINIYMDNINIISLKYLILCYYFFIILKHSFLSYDLPLSSYASKRCSNHINIIPFHCLSSF